MKGVVAITGGTRGIGLTIAEFFRGRDYAVAVCSRSARETSLHRDILHFTTDVRKRDQMLRFARGVVEHFGSLDVFVNCAGSSRWRAVQEIDETFVEEVIETALLGTLWGCAAAASVMKGEGCIVNLSSLAGKRGSANNSAYCAAKFGVNGITQSLAKELGPRKIRINGVCPVYVETKQILSALGEPGSPAQGQAVEAYLSSFTAAQTALGRLPTAQEVAEAVYFLASPAASAITGQSINVDCGVFPQ